MSSKYRTPMIVVFALIVLAIVSAIVWQTNVSANEEPASEDEDQCITLHSEPQPEGEECDGHSGVVEASDKNR